MEEADIILEKLKQGDKKGLELLFQRFYNPLVIYAYRFLKDQAEAEDTVQEVFIRFWNKNQFTDIQLYLRSYLYRSVHNGCLNRLENRKGISTISLDILKDLPVDEMEEESELIQRLEKIYLEIEKLPSCTRRIFQAVFLDNKKYKEVAALEQVSVNTVKTLLHRGVCTLREKLSSDFLFLLHLFFHKKSNF